MSLTTICRVYYDLEKNDDIVLEDGANKLTVHRVDLTEYVLHPAPHFFSLTPSSVTTWNPTSEAGAGIADMEPKGWVRPLSSFPHTKTPLNLMAV
jgi:hypothetical protein